jgi:iron complex transport system substrate-binding protein
MIGAMTRPPRLLAALIGLAALALATTACGSDDAAGDGDPATTAPTTSTDSSASTAPAPTSGPAADAFPVTIEHLWGSTTIDAAPERVVTLGVTDADTVLELGVTPVALTGFAFFDTGLGPWATPLVEGEMPLLLTGEPNVEQIATLDPDLILAISAGFDEPIYEQLAAIAPTVVRPAGTAAYQVPRDEATRMIATALGQPGRGEELIAGADAQFTAAAAAHPEFAGRTGVVVLPYDGKYGAYTPRDARGRFMAELGFELPPAIAALDDGSNFFIELSQEQVGLLDADVLVMLADAPDARAFVDGDQVLQQVPVVRDGRMVIPDTDTRGSITYNTPLSVPYAMDHLVPLIADALGA